ncbi:arylsulfatase [Ilumatobacter sp.]|uniref:arylsulfatase n=1 Tax=Ilumatobacter sp. TaxID=1967498 RepID=UPI003C61720E
MSRPSRFEGTIGRTIADSDAWFDEPPHPGTGTPNVVIVLLDDTGFAQFGCYGSDIDTAHIDALAANGLQFTNFHVTPLCSPTRASLLTGRSQHAVGMRAVSNFRTGFPNQLGHISNHAATVAEVLKSEGYATFCVGKWHLAPMEQCSAAGPFDQWPLARGFDRFYGFLEGETDQFHPDLVADNHPIEPPARSGPGDTDGYHVSEDMIDQLLKMVSDSKGVRPDRPFFAYVPFGATHAPHQAPQAYLDKYRGKYDEGWDLVRQRWYERQLELGVIPEGTELAPRNPGVEPWDSLPENQQKVAARLQEAFAGFLDHSDDQIGRLVAGLEHLGEMDNTIFVVLADNGASQEGGPFGVMHEMKFFNGVFDDGDAMIDQIDDIGGPHSHTNYPWGWAQCGNAPFKWYKQNTHEGGVHVPMIMHAPGRVSPEQTGRRDQFVNVSDIVPTIYEMVGITPPDTYRGIDQLPVTGHSFASTLDDAAAPPTNRLQYFEMGGSRALAQIDDDGVAWKAVCKHTKDADYDTETWELYRLSDDWSECNDLAEAEPDKLVELVDLWWSEAERHGVLPLDDRMFELFGARFRDNSPHPSDMRYVYRPPMSPMPGQASAAIAGKSFDLTARVTRSGGDGGVIYATGTENSGMSIFVQDDRLVVDYNAFDEHTVLESDTTIPDGDATLVVKLRRRAGMAGEMAIFVNGDPTGQVELPLFMRMMSSVGPSLAYDHGSPVSTRYTAPFPFEGTLHEVEIQLLSRQDAEARDAEAAAEMSRQ